MKEIIHKIVKSNSCFELEKKERAKCNERVTDCGEWGCCRVCKNVIDIFFNANYTMRRKRIGDRRE